uniref:hypothetical protein n=1 Tax=Clostridium botulinum TaxID=1491 RepID=UPI00155DBA68|nr:hypothetical protein [Clostridium botulinum]
MWEIVGFGWMGIDVLETGLTEEQAIERLKQIKKNKEYVRYDTVSKNLIQR